MCIGFSGHNLESMLFPEIDTVYVPDFRFENCASPLKFTFDSMFFVLFKSLSIIL